jgi:WD40 repeat protein
MPESGGPTTESGIFFQNTIAALYLGRMLDSRISDLTQRVSEVRVEAREYVDDVVVTFRDGHHRFIQAKEKIDPKPGDEAWRKLWANFEKQRWDPGFRPEDRLVIFFGSLRDDYGKLAELCERARGAADLEEWQDILKNQNMRKLEGEVRQLLSPARQNIADTLSLLQVVDVEQETLTRLESFVPAWMPPNNKGEQILFDALRTMCGGNARYKITMTEDSLVKELRDTRSLEIYPAVGGQVYTAEYVSTLLSQITTSFQPKPFDGRCPYKGLHVFEEEDAELFFGREKLVTDLVGLVKKSRAVFITGPSGSGKSSLVRAGLIPALKHGAIRDLHSERWLYETMQPGRHPLNELARVASSLAANLNAGDNIRKKGLKDAAILAEWGEIALKEGRDKRAVLFVDQFEEIFSPDVKEDERLAFLNLLTHAATVENGRMIILLSMRSDFISNCAAYPQVNALYNQQSLQIGAMQPEELVSAIAQPALRVGLRIDPALVAQIITDMKGEPGTLPLMQFALQDLFDAQQAKGGVIALTLNDYLQREGIARSLERHADDAFANLSDEEKELARSIFSGLVEVRQGMPDTRRTALFDELVPSGANKENVRTITHALANARLLTTDEKAGKDTVTLAHEKLIEAWTWLRKLVNDNRDAIALQNEIASDAEEWSEHNQDNGYLYPDARLSNIREQLRAKKISLSGKADAFMQAGIARQRRNRIILIGSISAVIVALILAVIIFRHQSIVYAQLAKKSMAGELAAQAIYMRDKNLGLSFLLSAGAYRMADNTQTRSALLDNTQANPRLLQYLKSHALSVNSVAFSPDGKTLASASLDNTIILWDVTTRKQIGQRLTGHTSSVFSVAYSPDGKLLASGGADSTIILWDMATRQPIGQPLKGNTGWVHCLAFSPDGRMLATGSGNGSIILWDVATRQPIGQPLTGHRDYVTSVAFSPDGRMLASGSNGHTILLWDVSTRQPIGQPLTGHTSSVFSVAFSPDGKTLASGSNDRSIILWDVITRKPIGQPLNGHTNSVSSVAFSPDGKTLASGSWDHTIILWDVATQKPIGQPLTGHTNSVSSVAFSLHGNILASASWDHTIILWDVTARQSIGQLLTGQIGSVLSIDFSPDGNILASGGTNNTILLSDVATWKPIGQPLKGNTGWVYCLAFSPDGKTLASGNTDNSIILWDVLARQPIGQPLTGHAGAVLSLAFSPDGKTLASGSVDETIILWNVSTLQPIGQPLSGHTINVSSVAFSPDGKTLASGSFDKNIILWDVATRLPIGQPLTGHTDSVNSVAFSPDGKTLASGSDDNSIILWDVATRQPIGQPLMGHAGSVLSLAFSPDGKLLASGSWDNTIILWDLATRQPIGQPLKWHTNPVSSVAFSPNGKILASGSWDDNVVLWDIVPQSWMERTCQRAGRNLTRAEWAQYFSSMPYPTKQEDATCPQWPLEPEATPTPTQPAP